ncbi:MAG TPA: hypothetical protein VLI04_14565 [Nocardioidaceae bacterium]|nr:hypothetical protein [Nocardioidaceae bacterium]
MSTTTDTRAQVLLPTFDRALPPVTARSQRRALSAYALLWLVGALPGLLDLGDSWTAAGLGLALPGGGFLYGGHQVLAVVALTCFVVSVFVWWASGPTVLPPLVWLGTAALSGFAADSPGTPVIALAAGPLLIATAIVTHRLRHRSQVRAGARLNEKLREMDFVITGSPGLDVRVPVVEHTPDDLAHLRYGLDLALQPLDSYIGFTKIDQFREAATRYQLNALSYSLSMSQFTRTPAFTGYLAEAQRNAIEKMLQREVWGYWALENAWGNLDLQRDPVDNSENIMLTGFHGLMVGMYESLNDDRYSRPGALTYRWNDRVSYANDFGTLANSIHRNVERSPYALFPCEPNWIYTVCNTFGMNTMRSHDRLHGTSHFARVEDRLRHSYETEFLRPDGRIIGVRSSHLGLSWNLWAGSSIQLTTAYWMHAALPDIAQRTWWLLRESALRERDGVLVTPTSLAARLDPGSYKVGADTYSQIVTMMAAREIGDEEIAVAAQRAVDEREEIAEANGARRYADASGMANLYANLGRFGRYSGLRDLVVYGAPEAWRQGPVLAEAAYPDVLVAKAVTDGYALDLVLLPGDGPVRTTLRLERLLPSREYAVTGHDSVVASEQGEGLVEIELGARREVRIYLT